MYQPHEIIQFILFAILAVYLIVFYGSLIISYVYGNYLHDGDKSIWSLHKSHTFTNTFYRDSPCDASDPLLLVVAGILLPIVYLFISSLVIIVTMETGMLVPYILIIIASSWSVLYVLRAVIRLNKKLNKHASDKDMHNG